jgi:TnpA family transposase
VTDHVFGLCHLFGFRFAPRIRDIKERKLYLLPDQKAPARLAPLVGGVIDTEHITAHWDQLLRLATSVRTRTTTSSAMLKKLSAYPRQNGLAKALREIGRIERTLFTLDWIKNPDLRRRAHLGLTLYTTPVIYLYLDRFRLWIGRRGPSREANAGTGVVPAK